MEKKLEVKNLIISFRTQGGKVQAVRNVSFDLYKGETLAIVGESGSGKSVTSRAVMGILAGNAIVEGGEILYDGKDLLKIPEEDMYKIRGDKIAMIFQDPLSSLDPIMRIGKQITEAMLLKNKANRKAGRKEFNKLLYTLAENVIASLGDCPEEEKARVKEIAKTFDAFNIKAIELENAYNVSYNAASEAIAEITEFAFNYEHKQKVDAKGAIKETIAYLKDTKNAYLTANFNEDIDEHITALNALLPSAKNNVALVVETLKDTQVLFEKIIAQEAPNFFRIGYYVLKNPTEDLSKLPVSEANEISLKFLNDTFMNEFIELEKQGIAYSHEQSVAYKKAAIDVLESVVEFYQSGDFTKAAAMAKAKEVTAAVEKGIDRLETVKDSIAYTFGESLKAAINSYFFYKKNNPKEEARFARQTAKRDKLIARGKKVDWKVVPKMVVELDNLVANILSLINRVKGKYELDVQKPAPNYEERCVQIIDYLKEKASQVVYRITPKMAREKAIKLMEEVGIPEPRIRYKQYPFEFSGGMRQRIVIAIALAANPDILICDEPTTALDVTIQAQILELINKLKAERNLSVIFITHDLGVVANMADRIAVMYAGKIVEHGTAEDIFYDPRHPYTWALLSSMPDLDTNEKLDAIPGTPPNMIYPPVGDAFADRNKYALQIDYEMQPPMFEISSTHFAATWLLHPDAPKVDIPQNIQERIKRMKKLSE